MAARVLSVAECSWDVAEYALPPRVLGAWCSACKGKGKEESHADASSFDESKVMACWLWELASTQQPVRGEW